MSMYRCDKHGGHGFVQDCEICNEEKVQAYLHERIAELEQELAIGVNLIRDYEEENASLKEQVRVLEDNISQRECYQRGFKAGRNARLERAAGIAYRVLCVENHVTLADNVEEAIRSEIK